jgi:hypothetical protein
MDDDGEAVQVSAEQIVWVTAPVALIDEGERVIEERYSSDEDGRTAK